MTPIANPDPTALERALVAALGPLSTFLRNDADGVVSFVATRTDWSVAGALRGGGVAGEIEEDLVAHAASPDPPCAARSIVFAAIAGYTVALNVSVYRTREGGVAADVAGGAHALDRYDGGMQRARERARVRRELEARVVRAAGEAELDYNLRALADALCVLQGDAPWGFTLGDTATILLPVVEMTGIDNGGPNACLVTVSESLRDDLGRLYRALVVGYLAEATSYSNAGQFIELDPDDAPERLTVPDEASREAYAATDEVHALDGHRLVVQSDGWYLNCYCKHSSAEYETHLVRWHELQTLRRTPLQAAA